MEAPTPPPDLVATKRVAHSGPDRGDPDALMHVVAKAIPQAAMDAVQNDNQTKKETQ